MIPRLRIAPPSPAQLAADPTAPYVLFATVDIDALTVSAATQHINVETADETARLVASKAALTRLAADLRAHGASLADDLERFLHSSLAWKLRTRSLPLDKPQIMGILNLTNDSFSGDGVGRSLDDALRRADELASAGADIIDIGAESARADRPIMDAAQEAQLVAPIVARLSAAGHCVSIDTYKPVVARAALEAGAEIVNDISGLTLDRGAATEAGAAGAAYVLNYSYSVPKRRPDSPPAYEDVVTETIAWMGVRLAQLLPTGLAPAQIAIDPGIAFGKSHDEDVQVLRRLGELQTLGHPILLAHSRKNYIGSINGQPPSDRDLESHVTSALAFEQGARIFRVHDPAGARRAIDMAAALLSTDPGAFAPDAESWPWRAGSSASHMTNAAPDKPAPTGQRW